MHPIRCASHAVAEPAGARQADPNPNRSPSLRVDQVACCLHEGWYERLHGDRACAGSAAVALRTRGRRATTERGRVAVASLADNRRPRRVQHLVASARQGGALVKLFSRAAVEAARTLTACAAAA